LLLLSHLTFEALIDVILFHFCLSELKICLLFSRCLSRTRSSCRLCHMGGKSDRMLMAAPTMWTILHVLLNGKGLPLSKGLLFSLSVITYKVIS